MSSNVGAQEAAAPAAAAAAEPPKSFVRRDKLRAVEKAVQAEWAAERAFETDAPTPSSWAGGPKPAKFMCTFPYPYMNGRLHLGHAFTVTKAEFAAVYQRMRGKRVLFPFAFHCTGMPIQAAANRLRRELETGSYLAAPEADDVAVAGQPADDAADGAADAVAASSLDGASAADAAAAAPAKVDKELGKFSGKKTKVAAKTGKAASQYDILVKSGIAPADIPAFTDPSHWLHYFPPLGRADLAAFGAHVDWRRSFITTDANPYYDAFIRWQFNTLRARDKIGFGKRPTIFSPLDGQACADHDRASGEGVQAQEYTLIKLRLQGVPATHRHAAALAPLAALLAEGRGVFFVAATLRPETMYGQTNVFMLPEGEYGAFAVAPGPTGDVFICSERSARNMAYQGHSAAGRGVVTPLGTWTGEQLLGLPLSAPLATFPTVYTLPLMTISMRKGTGVVTSVPSDAPDDWAALRDVQSKPALREKYGLTEAQTTAFDVVEIIDIPGFGRRAAVSLVDELKIKSQNDTAKLAAAKERVYTAGFYTGVMLVGPHAGLKVFEAKPLVRAELIAAGDALAYWEPEATVVSRSGDECVVADLDQWFLKYGDEDWKNVVLAWVRSPGFNAFTPACTTAFEGTLAWLREWACSRNFGLGTRLPWDPQFVIESLSDSTIYMAYYTVAHLLQGDMEGRTPGTLGLLPAQLTDAVFDHVFLDAPRPAAAPPAALEALRAEFNFWYPMDLRVSGKDLIQNHLTMSLYNHAAVWGPRPDRMPAAFFCNGHVQVDGAKMSKSVGNFIILEEAIARWGADATRLALADAGDGLDDANFERDTADAAILRLTTEEEWSRDVVADAAAGRLRDGAAAHVDRVFDAKIRRAIQTTAAAFDAMRFRDALRNGFYALQIDRDTYRDTCAKLEIPMHAATIRRFFSVQYSLLDPICPHFCRYMRATVLGLPAEAAWPAYEPVDDALIALDKYMHEKLHYFRVQIARATVGKAGKPKAGGAGAAAPAKATDANIYIASAYASWQRAPLTLLASVFDPVAHGGEAGGFPPDTLARVKALAASDPALKAQTKKVMEFAAITIAAQKEAGAQALPCLRGELPFDEAALWRDNDEYVRKALDLARVHIHDVSADPACAALEPTGRAKDVVPGEPVVHGYAVA